MKVDWWIDAVRILELFQFFLPDSFQWDLWAGIYLMLAIIQIPIYKQSGNIHYTPLLKKGSINKNNTSILSINATCNSNCLNV